MGTNFSEYATNRGKKTAIQKRKGEKNNSSCNGTEDIIHQTNFPSDPFNNGSSMYPLVRGGQRLFRGVSMSLRGHAPRTVPVCPQFYRWYASHIHISLVSRHHHLRFSLPVSTNARNLLTEHTSSNNCDMDIFDILGAV